MNKKQLGRFSLMCWILMIIFIGLDRLNSCEPIFSVTGLSEHTVYCLISNEIYEPFIWLFALLGVGFLIMSWLEKEK